MLCLVIRQFESSKLLTLFNCNHKKNSHGIVFKQTLKFLRVNIKVIAFVPMTIHLHKKKDIFRSLILYCRVCWENLTVCWFSTWSCLLNVFAMVLMSTVIEIMCDHENKGTHLITRGEFFFEFRIQDTINI